MTQIHVKLVKSLIDSHEDWIAAAQSLGLYKIGDCTMQPGNPQTKGKAVKIIYLIKVSKA